MVGDQQGVAWFYSSGFEVNSFARALSTVLGDFTQSSGDKSGHRCISTYAGLCLAQLSPMLLEFSALFRYAVAS